MRTIMFLLVLTSSAFADDVPPAPPSGLDPDVATRLADAERAAQTATPLELASVLDRVLVPYESDDPFSTAQRDAAKPRTLAVLTTIGERARAAGDLELAARAFDARWTLAGGGDKPAQESQTDAVRDAQPPARDPQLADVLAHWAERDAAARPAQALYLARRARTANPDDALAAHLDDQLSHNHRVWPGRMMVVAGIVALAAGIYARSQVSSIENDLHMHARPGDQVSSALTERDAYDAIGTGLLVAAPVLSIGGIVFIVSGQPSYTPSSPGERPALGGAR
ncbi:MAG TPA: hypothetical protein VLT45_13330 [Kofleriaceae bacterium]|nr:hypothetical protein [Kofleriaceae bacterium]